MTDISARREAEEMLQHVERRQRALITAVPSIIWRDELGAAVQPRNLDWEAYTGQTTDEEFGEGWLDAVHPDDRETMLHAWSNAMRDGSIYQADMRLRRHDGVYRWMAARGAPVRDKAGTIVEWIGLYEDVDERYTAREALRQRTEELGQRVKEMRCLHSITAVCNRDDMTESAILAAAALVLPSALVRPASGACLIEWQGATFASPGYSEPADGLRMPLEWNGPGQAGSITLGYIGREGELGFAPEERRLLETAANLLGQMLARRSDRERLVRQSHELWRRQAMFEQTERLAKVGGWDYDACCRRPERPPRPSCGRPSRRSCGPTAPSTSSSRIASPTARANGCRSSVRCSSSATARCASSASSRT